MDIQATSIPEVKIIAPKKFGDARGFFSETYNQRAFHAAGITDIWIQDNHSMSGPKGTVRGLHYQIEPTAQAKLVRVVKGAILDVAVDIRKGSPTCGKHVACEISADAWNQIYVPAGFAHGFCTLTPDTEVLYKVTALYSKDAEFGILWNDPALGIDWPVKPSDALLSDKDKVLPTFANAPVHFTYSRT
jgi:dTDP-4-dehydrorhamnose 3,5-epimerase